MTDETINNDLDETLDDLADLPKSAPFPPGAHHCLFFPSRNAKKKGSYVMKFKHIATLEFANSNIAEEDMPKQGDEAVCFVTTVGKDGSKNEIGQGQLKLMLAPLAELFNTKVTNEIFEQAKNGVEVVIVSGIREDKSGQYEPQMTVRQLEIYTG